MGARSGTRTSGTAVPVEGVHPLRGNPGSNPAFAWATTADEAAAQRRPEARIVGKTSFATPLRGPTFDARRAHQGARRHNELV